MNPGFIESHVARGNRNLIITAVVLIAIAAGLYAVGIWVPVPVAGVAALIVLATWVRRVLDPRAHPVYKRLARYGDVAPLTQQVDEEFAGVRADGEPHFGRRWLAQRHRFGLNLTPWDDVAWMHVYSRVRNGVMTDCSVHVYSRHGDYVSAATEKSTQAAEQLLRQLHERAPWAEVGYSSALKVEFQSERAKFLERVDARRQQLRPGARARA